MPVWIGWIAVSTLLLLNIAGTPFLSLPPIAALTAQGQILKTLGGVPQGIHESDGIPCK